MSRTRIIVALAVTALAGLSAAAAYAAATKSKVKTSFSTKATKKSTSLNLTSTLGHDANGNYGILTHTTVNLPNGTKFDKSTVPACQATDQEIANDPGGANKLCPANTKLGDVTADVIIVPPTPIHLAGPMFNRPGNKVIVELLNNGAPAYDIDGTIKGRSMDFPLPNAEQLGTKPTKITVSIPKHGTARKPFMRTPPTCPKSGKWKGSVFNQYGGAAASADKPTFTIACTPPKSK
jgi:hypothetical protein